MVLALLPLTALAAKLPVPAEIPAPSLEILGAAACAADVVGSHLAASPVADGERIARVGTNFFALTETGLTVSEAVDGRAVLAGQVKLTGRPQALWVAGDRAVVIGITRGADPHATLTIVDISVPDAPEVLSIEHLEGVLRGATVRDGSAVVVTGESAARADLGASDALSAVGGPGCGTASRLARADESWSTVRIVSLNDPDRSRYSETFPRPADIVAFGAHDVWIGGAVRTTHLTRIDTRTADTIGEIDLPGIVPSAQHLDIREDTIVAVYGRGASTSIGVFSHDGSVIGELNGLGQNEILAATRIEADRAYVVTVNRKEVDATDPIVAARQAMLRPKDPLYVIDLTHPAAPAELGALDISGWSDLLLPVGPGQLLATGVNDRKPVVSLFDVSDPHDPQLAARIPVPGLDVRAREDFPAWAWDAQSRTLALPTDRGVAIYQVTRDDLEEIEVIDLGASGIPTDAVFLDGELWSLGHRSGVPQRVGITGDRTAG